jgi:hypothetical protein
MRVEIKTTPYLGCTLPRMFSEHAEIEIIDEAQMGTRNNVFRMFGN